MLVNEKRGRESFELKFFWLLQTKLYVEDWIGLRALDEAGKVKYISVAGNHLGISQSDMRKYVVPYLENIQSSQRQRETVREIKMRANHGTLRNRNDIQVTQQHQNEASTDVLTEGSSSYSWLWLCLSSIKIFFNNLF